MHAILNSVLNNTKTIKMKQKVTKAKQDLRPMHVAILALFLLVFSASTLTTSFVAADRFQEQINALNAENSNKQASRAQLGAEAASIADVIAKLQAEINALQAKINENQAKVAELNVKIKEAEAELARQKDLLGQTIKAMYVEGDISTVEMLASSKNLSDFFDKQQYRESVRSKIKTTLDKITQLKLDLSTQKDTVEKLIAEQQTLQTQIAAQRAENDRILSLNQAQQAELNSQIKSNNGRIAELRRQQAEENARLFAGSALINGGACSPRPENSYPDKWCAAAQDSMIDSWGMYNRECVSYTAWKVAESGRRMPYWGGHGNANQWDENAEAAGIPVDTSPRAGDVAVSNRGYYGHVMYVESVNANGTINISQYNAGLNGTYSRVYNMSKAGLVFIHF
jgi:peptidoglycan DL-endopeptidase CwlO